MVAAQAGGADALPQRLFVVCGEPDIALGALCGALGAAGAAVCGAEQPAAHQQEAEEKARAATVEKTHQSELFKKDQATE